MAGIIRLLAAVFSLIFAAGSFAIVPLSQEWTVDQAQYGWRSTATAACSAGTPASNADVSFSFNYVKLNPDGSPWYCWYSTTIGDGVGGTIYTPEAIFKGLNSRSACPANSTSQGGACVCTPPAQETSGGQCVSPEPNQCAASQGTVSVVNFTAGWARGPNLDNPVGAFTAPGVSYQSACVAGCKVSIGDQANSTAWVSEVPAPSGLHRASVDSEVVGLGESCATTTPEADPTAPYMPCPGFVGEINGKTTCVGTADSPLPAGSGDTKPTRDAQNPTDSKGNPTAGSKPATGEGSGSGGSGRTPSAGTGTAAGGPAGAAGGSGTKPDGTKDKPGEGKEQANCGAPGQPKCGIDESGTPTGQAQKDDLKKAVEQAGKDTKAGIDAASKLKADGWSFTFQLPSSCSPLVLDGFSLTGGTMTLDVCRFQPTIHDIMALLWLATTVWCCIGMVGRTLRGA